MTISKRALARAPADAAHPTAYSGALARKVCASVARGVTLAVICQRPGMPDRDTVSRWFAHEAEFRASYGRALEDLADRYAKQILRLADLGRLRAPSHGAGEDRGNVAHLKLRIDTRKWLMARLAPIKYGGHTPSLAAVAAAKGKPSHVHELTDAQLDEIDGGED